MIIVLNFYSTLKNSFKGFQRSFWSDHDEELGTVNVEDYRMKNRYHLSIWPKKSDDNEKSQTHLFWT